MNSKEKIDIVELEEKFASLYENKDSWNFLAGLIDYLRLIENTSSLRAMTRKIMTSNPSPAISAMSELYKGLREVWEENYSPIEIVWADMHSPMAGGKSKYGFPMSFSVLQYARSTTRVFHDQLLYEIGQTRNQIFFEYFDSKQGVLTIGGKEIVIGKKTGVENNQVRLLATLTKDPHKIWFTDELVEDWEGIEEPNYKIPRNRFYDAAHKLNTTIGLAIGINNFIDATTKQVRINPTYLKKK